MSAADRAIVTTVVAVDPPTAFSIFTRDIGDWWKPRLPRVFSPGRSGVLRFERGRLLEVYAESDAAPFEIGRVLVWAPSERLVFEWRQGNFAPHEITEVEVRFEAAPGGTRVTIEHRGFEALPPDHPARDGSSGGALANAIALRWADRLTAFRARTGARVAAAQ